MYRYICDICGARLDPAEKCTCLEERERQTDEKAAAEEERFLIRYTIKAAPHIRTGPN